MKKKAVLQFFHIRRKVDWQKTPNPEDNSYLGY